VPTAHGVVEHRARGRRSAVGGGKLEEEERAEEEEGCERVDEWEFPLVHPHPYLLVGEAGRA
jgi:hypothetical protein